MNPEFEFAQHFPNFTVEEMRCPCGNCNLPIDDPEFYGFLQVYQDLRTTLGFPFHVTSMYRCPVYNDQLYVDMGHRPGDHLAGPHTRGAADMLVNFERMYRLIDEATNRGMGIGIKQHGAVDGRYVHIDNLGSRLWTYP